MKKYTFNYQKNTFVSSLTSDDIDLTQEEIKALYQDFDFIDDDISLDCDEVDENINIENDMSMEDDEYSTDYYSDDAYHSGSSYYDESPFRKSTKKPLGGIVSRIRRWHEFNTSKDIFALSQHIADGYLMNKHQTKRYEKIWMNTLYLDKLDNIEELLLINKNLKIGVKESCALLFNVHFLSKETSALLAQEETVQSPLKNLFYIEPERRNCKTVIGEKVIACINDSDFISKTASHWRELVSSDKNINLSFQMLKVYQIMRKRWDFVATMNEALELNIESDIAVLAKKYDSDVLRQLLQLVEKDFNTMIDHEYYGAKPVQATKQVVNKPEEIKNTVPDEAQEVLDNIYKTHHKIKSCNVKLEVEQEHRVHNIMTQYLPQVMDHYFSIDPQYRDNLKDHNNLTSNELLQHTLTNILATLQDIDQAINLDKIKKLSVAKHYTASFRKS